MILWILIQKDSRVSVPKVQFNGKVEEKDGCYHLSEATAT